MQSKSEIRRDMRAHLPPDDRVGRSARICDRIAALSAWEAARVVAMFAPQLREPDVEGLWPFAAGKTLAYPIVTGDGLALHATASRDGLQPGRWGIREPLAHPDHRVDPADVDLILVPGVAFTLAGARCGRGGGYYDRLLALLPAKAVRVGVCFAEQILDELPVEPHDATVNIVIAE
jgi:5-formyltetrahydrofolate cyclo-ligase